MGSASVQCYDQLVKGTNLMPFSSDWTPSGTTTKTHNLSSKERETQNIIGHTVVQNHQKKSHFIQKLNFLSFADFD